MSASSCPYLLCLEEIFGLCQYKLSLNKIGINCQLSSVVVESDPPWFYCTTFSSEACGGKAHKTATYRVALASFHFPAKTADQVPVQSNVNIFQLSFL